MDAFSRATRSLLPLAPRFLVRPVGLRYVAGETLDDAMSVVRQLRQRGLLATVDVLGEDVQDEARALEAVREYLQLLEALERDAPDATVSIKPTLMGTRVSMDLARRNLDEVFAEARHRSVGVQIDMEDHFTTDDTLDLYHEMLRAHGSSGVALQARLRRTLDDVETIDPAGAIRLCKGIYAEPEDVAFTRPDQIDASFLRALAILLDRHAYVGIATHDDRLVQEARKMIRARALDPSRYEFQMLLGVREPLRDRLVHEGHRVRVYVPYGRDWYAYSMRRLHENPRVARYVLKALITGD